MESANQKGLYARELCFITVIYHQKTLQTQFTEYAVNFIKGFEHRFGMISLRIKIIFWKQRISINTDFFL